MKITFGLHLDGQRVLLSSNSLGDITVGPQGFLNILETQLGLLSDQPSHAERIAQYRDCLSSSDSPLRFYHASFATDELGTAATLLGWRDLWFLHGWNGQMFHDTSPRLSDLAEVEVLADQRVALSIGQRLAHVQSEIKQRQPPILQVRLMDPIEVFPRRWQAILALLPVIPAYSDYSVNGLGFLGELQHNLSSATQGKSVNKLTWQNDGSVIVVQSETRSLAASWLASQLNDTNPTLLVSPADGARLDAHLSAAGQSRQGLHESSAFRPTLQVLSLALEILWDPLNFHGLVQFLTHPVSPIPGYARRKLATKVADAPGIGGQRWEQVLANIDQHYGDTEAPKVRDKIREWVEHSRFPLNGGAPIDVVIDRVQKLVEFFRAQLGIQDVAQRMAFHAGYAQCYACMESLKLLQMQGLDVIRPRQLQQLVTQATASGTDNLLLVAEVGAQLVTTHPGAAISPIERVIWWQLTMPALPSAYPWSTAELHVLANAGVVLPSTEQRLAQVAREWFRPVLAAKQQLLLVLPPQGEEVHPLWQMIEAVISKPEIQNLEQLLTDSRSALTRVVDWVSLPTRKRWWQLPDDLSVPLSAKESFSSLELLLFNPYHWLLKYPAALRPSSITGLGGDFRMLGNLAHGLIERYYQRTDALSMTDSEFEIWFGTAFEQLINEDGAFLRMAGCGADLQSFSHRLHYSIQTLRQQIASAKIVTVTPEMPVTGLFIGGDLTGAIDLVMQNLFGGQVIVDMKWSGVKKFPEKLKQNRQLQLAIYAELLRQKHGAWPSVAYYVLDKARLFTPDDRIFPKADVVPSTSGENTPELWLRFLETWKWRKAQVEAGAFEVALENIEETDESIPPESAMTPEYLNASYNEYLALAGWE